MGKPARDHRGDLRAGLPRIHANQHAWRVPIAPQVGSQAAPDPVKRAVVERVFAGNPADSIGTEQFFGHSRVLWHWPKVSGRAAEQGGSS